MGVLGCWGVGLMGTGRDGTRRGIDVQLHQSQTQILPAPSVNQADAPITQVRRKPATATMMSVVLLCGLLPLSPPLSLPAAAAAAAISDDGGSGSGGTGGGGSGDAPLRFSMAPPVDCLID